MHSVTGPHSLTARMRRVLIFTLLSAEAYAQSRELNRALQYLSAEVPRWRVENGCFSCHNNGDGARALYAAGLLKPASSTTEWLRAPGDWGKGKMDNPGSDRNLALYQFAAALTSANEAGVPGL